MMRPLQSGRKRQQQSSLSSINNHSVIEPSPADVSLFDDLALKHNESVFDSVCPVSKVRQSKSKKNLNP